MAIKRIYLVRHGESEYNLSETMLGHDTPLTPRGLAQADICAQRCATLDFEAIFTSTYQRAVVTGEAIQRTTGKPIIKNPLFLEYRYPEAVVGMPKKGGPNHLHMIGGIETRYEGGESFADLLERALEALVFFEHRPEHSCLLVSHGFFIHMFITAILFGDQATYREFERIVRVFPLSNTGITHCVFDDERSPERKWRIMTCNDDAHLGEIA